MNMIMRGRHACLQPRFGAGSGQGDELAGFHESTGHAALRIGLLMLRWVYFACWHVGQGRTTGVAHADARRVQQVVESVGEVTCSRCQEVLTAIRRCLIQHHGHRCTLSEILTA